MLSTSPSATTPTTTGKRGRDEEEDRDNGDKYKKIDELSLIDLKIEVLSKSELRKAILLFLKNANKGKNLGDLPSSKLMTKSKNLKTDGECSLETRAWLMGTFINVPQDVINRKFTHLAVAFAQVVRALRQAGRFSELVEAVKDFLVERLEDEYDL